jgi:pyruvate/2-oxoacid:ferredoxin oxidoreductase alpha subunit
MTVELLSANHAAAKAAALAGRANRKGRGFGGGVYPITPQTECIELLCDLEIEKGSIIRVESEHSAMAVCIGFSLGGARAFTASSSNGLAYMTENVFTAAMYRLPLVMMAVNRTLGPPWNIWVDHGDTLMLRDSGWIQFYCEDNQEVADTILLAFRLAEDARVSLPAMVCQDAFVLSHTMMLTDLPEQDAVDRFLPTLDLAHRLGDRPRTIGGLDFPHETEIHRRELAEAMKAVREVYAESQAAFERAFGRRPADAVVPYRMDDAECVLVSMGTTAATVRAAVDEARGRGIKAGALRVRMFRPFPEADLRRLIAGRKRVAVLDRDLCPGFGGILWGEVRGCAGAGSVVQGYVLGLGGGDIRPEHVGKIIDDVLARKDAGEPLLMEVES